MIYIKQKCHRLNRDRKRDQPFKANSGLHSVLGICSEVKNVGITVFVRLDDITKSFDGLLEYC